MFNFMGQRMIGTAEHAAAIEASIRQRATDDPNAQTRAQAEVDRMASELSQAISAAQKIEQQKEAK